MWWHTVTHGLGKWGENWRKQWVASTLHTTSEHGVSIITTADTHTSVANSRLNWRPPADLNGLVRFAERRNLVSALVPSRFNWPVRMAQHETRWTDCYEISYCWGLLKLVEPFEFSFRPHILTTAVLLATSAFLQASEAKPQMFIGAASISGSRCRG
jgi:hypothetical protein